MAGKEHAAAQPDGRLVLFLGGLPPTPDLEPSVGGDELPPPGFGGRGGGWGRGGWGNRGVGVGGEGTGCCSTRWWAGFFSRRAAHHARFGTVGRRERTATAGLVRELPSLSRSVPDAGFRRTLRHGRQEMYFLSDYRAARLYPGRVSRADGKSCFRLRHLPRRFPMKPPPPHSHATAVPAQT